MPELPEVEIIVHDLNIEHLIGLEIERASVFWDRSIAMESGASFSKRIANQSIQNISRRGKFLVFTLNRDTLLVHLRMTGKFFVDKEDVPVHPHERVRLYLSDGRLLRYEDQRKFGKWYLLSDPALLLGRVGLEPLSKDFTFKAFNALFNNNKRKVKPFLLDQKYVAGLGNIYVDEALWEAGIHPLRTMQSLNDAERKLLRQSIILVLQRGIENTGTSLGLNRGNYFSVSGRRGNNQTVLKVFRRDGLLCNRCNSVIQKIVVAQRGTHFCPTCQSLKSY